MAEGVAVLPAGVSPEHHFADLGLSGRAWSAGPGAFFPPHHHERTKHLFVLRGSISFNGTMFTAPAGMVIAAGSVHEATAGGDGVECVEAFEGEEWGVERSVLQ